MVGLDGLQKIILTLFYLQITVVFLGSLWQRKRITLGTVEVTAIPGLIVYLVVSNFNFASTGAFGLQIVGLILFILGGAFGAWAFSHLGYENSDDFWFGRKEPKKRTLVTTGPYKYVRHPVFIGLAVQFFGLTLALLNLISLVLWLVLVIFGAYTSLQEEKFLAGRFPEYDDYKLQTGRFLPKF